MSQVPDQRPRSSRIFRRADASSVPLRTIVTSVIVVIGALVAVLLLYRLRLILLLMLVGGFVALLLNPLVAFVQRHGIRRRGGAVAVVAAASVVVFVGLAILFGYPLVNSMTRLANALPSYVHKAQTGQGWIGHLLRRYHVSHWVTDNASKLVSLAQGLSRPALALGRGAISGLVALITVFTFVVLVLLEAPRLRQVWLAALPPQRAQRVARIGTQVGVAVSGYMVGNLATSLIAGLVVFVTLTIVGVPFAALFALWVGMVDFLPTIGGALAGIPTVLFAFGHTMVAGIVTLVVFVVYTQIENHILNPLIMGRTTRVSPLAVFVAVLVGAELGDWLAGLFGGFVGVLVAVPVAASLQVIVIDLRARESDRDPPPA
ncbi:MAG: AI-2E family transporter [Acidimicrobiales bacterium]